VIYRIIKYEDKCLRLRFIRRIMFIKTDFQESGNRITTGCPQTTLEYYQYPLDHQSLHAHIVCNMKPYQLSSYSGWVFQSYQNRSLMYCQVFQLLLIYVLNNSCSSSSEQSVLDTPNDIYRVHNYKICVYMSMCLCTCMYVCSLSVFACVVPLTVTVASRPSGTLATMIPIRNTTHSNHG